MKKVTIIISGSGLAIMGIVYTCSAFFGNTTSELTLYGNIEVREVTLAFQVPGKISQMLKEEGDAVKKGEVIATLDSRDYENSLEMAKATVKKTEAISREAKFKYDKNAPLCKKNVLAQQDYETLLKNKNYSEAEYETAITSQKTAENRLEYTRIYAPDDGIITTRIQEPGAIAAAGQGIYTLCKRNPVWVRVYVSEPDLGNIKYGMKVKVFTDTINPHTKKLREYEGRIGYISPIAEFTPKTVQSTDQRANLVYKVRIYIDNKDDFLRQGMPTTVKIDLNSL